MFAADRLGSRSDARMVVEVDRDRLCLQPLSCEIIQGGLATSWVAGANDDVDASLRKLAGNLQPAPDPAVPILPQGGRLSW